ncbi:hypothetical protein DMN91_005925 [Ooceraea biroi]|uniref:Reverse transcriptase domain-containing protein n=1 Tax=Ooceraea biroi TaxID=2015173 RepID=A0A3L8DMY5_OOCBI|nr:hypothetical protein DMN91_005925 [Ooceraea biroi]
MRSRDLARRRWKKCRCTSCYDDFRKLRNEVQVQVRNAKKNFYSDCFGKSMDQKETWSKLRSLGLIKPRGDGRSLMFTADEFNNYFVTASGSSRVGHERIYLGELEYGDEKLYLRDVTPREVSVVLKRNNSLSTGVDGLFSKLINLALPCILPVLTHIFNYSLLYGTFPDIWKAALVVLLPKIKSPTSVQHFRPISILCFVSKALERLVAKQITDFLELNNLFDPFQSAYRKGHSTQTALVTVLDDIRWAVDKRMVTVSVFFDFFKAFDCVSHRLLIEKLRKLNFSCSALRWLCSYLDNRCQAVRDPSGQRSSSFINVDIGVPQGSVLGPLLFLLFVSDLGPVLRHVKFNFYADDLMIYIHCDPFHLVEAIRDLNEDIDNIWRWAVANGLRLNPSKTKAIILGTSRFINAIHGGNVPKIVVGGEVIPYLDSVVYLGLTITNNLYWEKHVNVMVGRIHATLYRLKLFKEVLPQCARKSLVAALILPLFDYCCSAICDVTGEQNVRLQRAMNASVRFIFQCRLDAHITPLIRSLKWLKVDERRKYFMGSLLHSVILTGKPCTLFKEFAMREEVCLRSTRTSGGNLVVPICRTETFKRSFRCLAAEFWNALPLEIRTIKTVQGFKNGLYEYLLTTVSG